MKLFGETYLGGEVDFVSSEAKGTTFHLRLPKKYRCSEGPWRLANTGYCI
jgi:hypothetical protein